MTTQGWSIASEYEEDSYSCQLEKDDMVAGMSWDNYGFNLGFASAGEWLYY